MKGLSPDEQDQLKQYGNSIKEIKKKMVELIQKGHSNLTEQGGNMSSGLILHDEE
jgi:hypothetical protein